MLSVVPTTGRISTTAYCEHTIQARLTKNVRMSFSIQKVCAFTEWSIGIVYTHKCGDKCRLPLRIHTKGVPTARHPLSHLAAALVTLHMDYSDGIPAILSHPSACAPHTRAVCLVRVCVWMPLCVQLCLQLLVWFDMRL